VLFTSLVFRANFSFFLRQVIVDLVVLFYISVEEEAYEEIEEEETKDETAI